jgi:hypothetical protein
LCGPRGATAPTFLGAADFEGAVGDHRAAAFGVGAELGVEFEEAFVAPALLQVLRQLFERAGGQEEVGGVGEWLCIHGVFFDRINKIYRMGILLGGLFVGLAVFEGFDVGVDEEGFVLDDFDADQAKFVGGDGVAMSDEGFLVQFFFGADVFVGEGELGFESGDDFGDGPAGEGFDFGAGAEAHCAVGEFEGFEAFEFGGVGFGPGAGEFGFFGERLVDDGEGFFVALADFGKGGVEFGLLFVAGEGEFGDFADERFEIGAGGDGGLAGGEFEASFLFHKIIRGG